MTIDLELFRLLNSFVGQAGWLDALIVFCAEYLPYILIGILLAAALARAGRRRKLYFFFVPIISALFARVAVVGGIRFFLHRPRPFVALGIPHLLTEASYSFPSGHAIFFFALSTAVFFYNKTLGIWFFIASIIIGAARIIAGVHYPTDILGGAILGILVGWLGTVIARRFNLG